MIVDIPTSEDFYISGKELLDFAWDTVAELIKDLDDLPACDEEVSDAYWRAARRRLTTALSITQQGVEFILKGKIAEVSVFLLIAGDPSKWPSPYNKDKDNNNKVDIKFHQFRTLDAQDLIRVHDTVSKTPLSPEFVTSFNLLRDKRNRIMHSIDKNLSVQVTEVIDSILFMHKCLFPSEAWGQIRHQFIFNSPNSEIGGTDYVKNIFCRELSLVFKLLPPAKIKTYFGVNKKEKSYFCPECYLEASHNVDFDYKLAFLKPKGASSTRIYCPACNSEYEVIIERCKISNCLGTVISKEHNICLTCGAESSDEAE